MKRARPSKRRICFVTGTRAEFGLMSRTLAAIRAHPKLELSIIATGQHLDASRGKTIDSITRAGFKVDASVKWRNASTLAKLAASTGRAIEDLSKAIEMIDAEIILVVGDRVEAFAAASAAQLAGRIVAHVHGGEVARGQVDDTLRHVITKLSHLHFTATAAARDRVIRMGEAAANVFHVGAPGVESIRNDAASRATLKEFGLNLKDFALVLLHPADADDRLEYERSIELIRTLLAADVHHLVALYPNIDPGADGIVRAMDRFSDHPKLIVLRHADRGVFLGLLRDARVLVGNSSSGIIEAGSFGTPVVNIGPRQLGRESGANVAHVSYDGREVAAAVRRALQVGRFGRINPYERPGTSRRIAQILASPGVGQVGVRKIFVDQAGADSVR